MKSPVTIPGFTNLVYLTCYLESVLALPDHLLVRQSSSCESWICPNDAWKAIWGTLFGGAAAEWYNDFVKPDNNQPQGDGQNPTAEQPKVELFITAPPSGQQECTDLAPSPDLENSGTPNFRLCDTVTEVLIFPRSCQDMDQNKITATLVSAMDRNHLTSIDHLCPVEGGVFFWLAHLTPLQIDSLGKDAITVKAVVSNIPDEARKLVQMPARTNVLGPQKRSYLKTKNKRALVRVIKEPVEDQSLSFLSTAKNKPNSNLYSYFSEAGEGVQIYIMDSGLDSLNPEFEGVPLSWLYAIRSQPRESDDITNYKTPSGTCVASKIAGKRFGVAKNVFLKVVKVGPNIASFLDGLQKIISDLAVREKSGQEVKGRTVINIRSGYMIPLDGSVRIYIDEMERLIGRTMVNRYQIAIVTSSGWDSRGTYSDINQFPALLARNPEFRDIIVVGNVKASLGPDNGERYRWSQGGAGLTVSAPGNGLCSISANGVMEVLGSAISTAVVSGLVAYFLSLPDLGPNLRDVVNSPEAIIRYIKRMSYVRFDDLESPWKSANAVWNGLDSDSRTEKYLNWLGTPI